MGHIRERKLKAGPVRYQAEIRLKGYSPLTATFNRKTDAKAWIQKTEADIRCGRHHIYGETQKKTFREALERYRKEKVVSQVKEGHFQWWLAELGPLYLQDIRPAILSEKKQKLLSEVNSKGKKRSGSTCNRYLATLSHLLSVCVKEWEWLGENPVSKIAREREPRERTRFLSPEERKRFLEACRQSDNPMLFLFVVLLLSTGCRYNEIRFLKWTDIDLQTGKITLHMTKNKKIHSVPLRGVGLDILRQLVVSSSSIGYVFVSANPQQPMDPRRALKTAIKRAGLKDFRPHDCRHSFATEMLAQGLSIGEVSRLLNHLNISVTMRYAHLVESRSSEAISKMTDQILGGVTHA